jgi:hypothetical protein
MPYEIIRIANDQRDADVTMPITPETAYRVRFGNLTVEPLWLERMSLDPVIETEDRSESVEPEDLRLREQAFVLTLTLTTKKPPKT